jgi:hypothetical protein
MNQTLLLLPAAYGPEVVLCLLLEKSEGLWGDVLVDGEVVLGGPEVLAEGEDVDVVCTKVRHRLSHLVQSLAKAEHERALREEPLFGLLLGVLEAVERLVVGRASVANKGLESAHGLDVVRIYIEPAPRERRHLRKEA